MKQLPHTPEILRVASRVVRFKEPAEALKDLNHFLAHVMTYGTIEDLQAVSSVIHISEFREALKNAPPGIFDSRSWAYWNLVCGRIPMPPLPMRQGLN